MMNDAAHMIWIALVLLIVMSALLARRMPVARLLAWAVCWTVLFLGIYYLFTLIEPRIANWQQVNSAGKVRATNLPTVAGGNSTSDIPSGAGVAIPMQRDGHYWVEATVNGRPVRFLVDSGASITALSQGSAESLGLLPDTMNRTMVLNTANGAVTVARSVIPAMRIGTIDATDLPVVVSASFGDTNVLGMNFLNKLRSWRVEDGNMVLVPR